MHLRKHLEQVLRESAAAPGSLIAGCPDILRHAQLLTAESSITSLVCLEHGAVRVLLRDHFLAEELEHEVGPYLFFAFLG